MSNTKYTTKNPPEVGQDVYGDDGMLARFVALSPKPYNRGLVVCLYHEGIQDDEYFDPEATTPGMLSGSFVTWQVAYENPPVFLQDAQIAQRKTQLAELIGEIKAKRDEINKLDQNRAIIMREAKANPDLAPLALWLDGKAKFATILGTDYGNQWDARGTKTGPTPDIFKNEDRDIDRGKIRLVSLFYEPETDYQYSVRIMRYASGDSDRHPQRVFLGETAEESLQLAANHILERGKTNRFNDWDYAEMGKWLETFGFAHMRTERMIQQQVIKEKQASKNLAANAAKELERAREALKQAEAKFQQYNQPEGAKE